MRVLRAALLSMSVLLTAVGLNACATEPDPQTETNTTQLKYDESKAVPFEDVDPHLQRTLLDAFGPTTNRAIECHAGGGCSNCCTDSGYCCASCPGTGIVCA